MAERDYEKEVIDYLMENYPIRKSWFKKDLVQITRNSTLEGDYNLIWEDAEEMLLDIFQHFNIEHSDMKYELYIEYEYPFWVKKPTYELRPLTVGMIIESAKAGRWIYD